MSRRSVRENYDSFSFTCQPYLIVFICDIYMKEKTVTSERRNRSMLQTDDRLDIVLIVLDVVDSEGKKKTVEKERRKKNSYVGSKNVRSSFIPS